MARKKKAPENAAVVVLRGTVHIATVNNTNVLIRGGTVSIDTVNKLFIPKSPTEASEGRNDALNELSGFVLAPGAIVEADASDIGNLEDGIAFGPFGAAPFKDVFKAPGVGDRG